MSRKILERCRKFLEISREVLESSKTFLEKSGKLLDMSRKFLEIPRKFLAVSGKFLETSRLQASEFESSDQGPKVRKNDRGALFQIPRAPRANKKSGKKLRKQKHPRNFYEFPRNVYETPRFF